MIQCICGGKLTFDLTIRNAPGCCCGECYIEFSAELEVHLSCNKCKTPKLDGKEANKICLSHIEDLLNV